MKVSEEQLNKYLKMNYNDKLTLARSDYESIMQGVDPNWKMNCLIHNGSEEGCSALSVRTGIQVFAALISFGDMFFTESEKTFLKYAVDLDETEAQLYYRNGKRYYLNAISVFQQYLGEKEQSQLVELLILLATVDGQAAKKELKWINKLLMFIL